MSDFIVIENASFTYPSRAAINPAALTNINLTIREGEFIALIGANGSGKSTLVKLMNALLLPDSGRILVSGLDTRERSSHVNIRTQVGMVFQRPQDQIIATTVEEEVAFGPGNLCLEPKEIRARVEEALSRTGLEDFQKRPSYLLSAGETQRLALAGVLAMRPRCIIFDETTAMLDPAGREMVMAQIKELHRQGITTILITHLMSEAVQAKRVIVLQQGSVVLDNSPAYIFSSRNSLEDLGLDMPPAAKANSLLRKFFPGMPGNILKAENLFQALPTYQESKSTKSVFRVKHTDPSPDCINIRKLSFTYLKDSPLAQQALNHLDMSVDNKSIHGLIGGTGSGKSTILQHINGLIRPQSGSVLVGQFDLADKDLEIKALRRKITLAFQQPEDQFFEQYVGDEIAYAPRHLGYNGKLKDVVENAMFSVGLDFEAYKDRLTSTLSGGEKRKVALASVLAIQAEIILLDEPLSGLDPQACRELTQHLKQIHQNGITLLISTHQYEELLPIMESVSVIHKGKDITHGRTNRVFSQIQDLENVGLKAPLGALIAEKLHKKGWPINPDSVSLSSIERQLAILSESGKV